MLKQIPPSRLREIILNILIFINTTILKHAYTECYEIKNKKKHLNSKPITILRIIL